MKLILTSEQQAAIEPHIRHGWTLIGKVEREMFTGSNAGTAGQLRLELGVVPNIALPSLREALTKATATAPVPRKKGGRNEAAPETSLPQLTARANPNAPNTRSFRRGSFAPDCQRVPARDAPV